MNRPEIIALLQQHLSPRQVEEVIADLQISWPEFLNIEQRDQWPFATAKVFLEHGRGDLEFVGVARTYGELRKLVAKIEEDYFQIHMWCAETFVGNGIYFHVGEILTYQEFGACRGMSKQFADRFTEFIDELSDHPSNYRQ